LIDQHIHNCKDQRKYAYLLLTAFIQIEMISYKANKLTDPTNKIV